MLRAYLVVLMVSRTATAAPSGYQCAPGKAKIGVGCDCPATHAARFDAENIAICTRRPPAPVVSVEADPAITRARSDYERGRTARNEQDYEEAIRLFKRSRSLHEEPDVVYEIAATLELASREEEALPYYRRFLQIALPSTPRFRAATAQVELLEKKYPVKPMKIAADASDEDLWTLGSQAFETLHYDDAITAYKQLYTAFPKSERAQEALFFVGRVYHEQYVWVSALKTYRRLIDLYPNGTLADDALYFAAQAARALGSCTEAAGYLDTLTKQYKNSNAFADATQLQRVIRAEKAAGGKCVR